MHSGTGAPACSTVQKCQAAAGWRDTEQIVLASLEDMLSGKGKPAQGSQQAAGTATSRRLLQGQGAQQQSAGSVLGPQQLSRQAEETAEVGQALSLGSYHQSAAVAAAVAASGNYRSSSCRL